MNASPDPARQPRGPTALLRYVDVPPDPSRPSARCDLEVMAGELVVICGPVGSGKSALLRMAIGLQRPVAGRVLCLGAPVPRDTDPAVDLLRRRVGWVPQSGALLSNLSLQGNLDLPLRFHEDPDATTVTRRREETLALMGIETLPATIPPLVDRPTRRRVAVARALMLRPPLLLLDEPTDGMDTRSAAEMWLALDRVRHTLGTAILVATGDAAPVTRVADRVVELGGPQPSRPQPTEGA